MLYKKIEEQLKAAVAAVLPDADLSSVLVRPCPDPKFGDYQTNSLMALAKVVRRAISDGFTRYALAPNR